MAYMGTTINQSPTIAGTLGAAIAGDASCLAVKCDDNGNFIKTGDGEAAIGFILPSHADDLKAGDEVSIQIKDIGLAKSGAPLAKGAALTVDANGKVIAATAGKYIVGYALKAASSADQMISIQITKSGYQA